MNDPNHPMQMQMPPINGNGNLVPSPAPPLQRAPPNPGMMYNNQAMMNPNNPAAVAYNRALLAQNINPSMLTTLPHYSPSTQEILKRVSAPPPTAGSPEWEAARRAVLNSMASNNGNNVINPTHTAMHFPSAQGTRRTALGSGSAGIPTPVEANPIAAPTPDVKPPRGRGRGRPRGSRARGVRGGGGVGSRGGSRGASRGTSRGASRGGGRGGKRKREASDVEEEDNDTETSENYTPQAIVTKSGRNVQKPSQFNPAIEASPTSASRPRRSYRRGPEFTLCVKCQRGHSSASNMIVFCDGCNSAFHQWCHDPLIPKEVVEIADKEWFCGKCKHSREMDSLKLEDRVAAQDLTSEEKSIYFSTLSSATLGTLLLHAATLHPDLPIFAPNTRSIVHQHRVLTAQPTSPLSTPLSNIPSPTPDPTNNHNGDNHDDANNATSPAPSAPYPDYANPAGDPPATYPRPGAGPIRLQATTEPEDLPWLLDDNFEVFSHLEQDASGALVPVPHEGSGAGISANHDQSIQNTPGPRQFAQQQDMQQQIQQGAQNMQQQTQQEAQNMEQLQQINQQQDARRHNAQPPNTHQANAHRQQMQQMQQMQELMQQQMQQHNAQQQNARQHPPQQHQSPQLFSQQGSALQQQQWTQQHEQIQALQEQRRQQLLEQQLGQQLGQGMGGRTN